MPSSDVTPQVGITIVFPTSAYVAQILDVGGPDQSVEDIPTSHQGTSGGKTYIPGALVENGEVQFDVHYNPDTTPPVGVAQTGIIITNPEGATEVFDGYMKSHSPQRPFEGKPTATIVVKVSGNIVRTPVA